MWTILRTILSTWSLAGFDQAGKSLMDMVGKSQKMIHTCVSGFNMSQ